MVVKLLSKMDIRMRILNNTLQSATNKLDIDTPKKFDYYEYFNLSVKAVQQIDLDEEGVYSQSYSFCANVNEILAKTQLNLQVINTDNPDTL